jgi:glycosyltransferase involved in cell wall biosynthesis
MKLSIILPAHNEENRIEKTLKHYIDFFEKKMNGEYEILIIPNNCKDNTVEIVEAFARKYNSVFVKNLPNKAAKGLAVLEGFRLAKGDYVGFVDADESTPPDAFYDLYTNVRGSDGIIASRWIKGSNIGTKQPFIRRFVSRVFNLIVRVLFFIPYNDTQCGAKLFRKDVAKSVVDELILFRWAFDVNLLYLMRRKKYEIKEIPTVWNDSEGSVLNVVKASFDMFKSLIKLRLYYSIFRKWVKI